MASCKMGIHPDEPPLYQTPWSCKKLGGPGSPAPPHKPRAGPALTRPPYTPWLDKPSKGKLLVFYMYHAQGEANYPLRSINVANLAGVIWYLDKKVFKGTYTPNNKFGITRILRLKVQMKATGALLELGMNFGMGVDFASGKCTEPTCSLDWAKFGYNVGCSRLSGKETFFPDVIRYSLPGPCPSKPYMDQTSECKKFEKGGYCKGTPTGAGDCTWNYEEAGEITLSDLYQAAGGDPMQFWSHSSKLFVNKAKVEAAQSLFSAKYGADPKPPPCDYDRSKFFNGAP